MIKVGISGEGRRIGKELEESVNAHINNTCGLTTEQVKNRPIKTESGRIIGKTISADENLIYGIVHDISVLYDDTKKSFEMVMGSD